MTIPAPLLSFNVTRFNQKNGQIGPYKFSLTTEIPLKSGDKVSMNVPRELELLGEVCESDRGVRKMSCLRISRRKMIVIFEELERETGTFEWTVYGVKNGLSLKPSSSFTHISIHNS